MIEVELALVLFSPNILNPLDTKILLLVNESLSLPTCVVDTSIDSSISHLLKQYTGLQARINNSGWVELKQGKVVDKISTENKIIIPFGGMIPETVKPLESSKWSGVVSLLKKETGIDKTHLDIIQNMSRTI